MTTIFVLELFLDLFVTIKRMENDTPNGKSFICL